VGRFSITVDREASERMYTIDAAALGNAAVRQIVGEARMDLGFHVPPAETRRQALDQLLDAPDTDLLLVDVLDDAAGGEALLAFVADQPELARIPLIVMTDGAAPMGVAAHAIQLAKPFDVEALGTAVLDAMAGRGEQPGTEPPRHPAR
jgi:DNA-binding NtrC family response regulator